MRARAELVALFPPESCRRITAERSGLRLLASLFTEGVLPWTCEHLLLGEDLACCTGWRNAKNLVNGLQNGDEHRNARFEAGVWAALRRAGLPLSYEPQTLPGGKSADFVVDEAGGVVVEVKCLRRSQADLNRDVLAEIVGEVSMALEREGVRLEFAINADLLQRCPTTDRRAFEVVAESIREAACAWIAEHADLPDGEHQVPGLGVVRVSSGVNAGVMWSTNVDEDDLDVVAKRVARTVREASGQASQHAGAIRAAVVRVPEIAPDFGSRLESAILAHADRTPFLALDAIVLVSARPWRPTTVGVCLLKADKPWLPEMRWARALQAVRLFSTQPRGGSDG